MKMRRRPRLGALLGLVALLGSATVVPYLHTCFVPDTTSLAVRAADDLETSAATHRGCAVCALASTVRTLPAIGAGALPRPVARTLVAAGVLPQILAGRAEAKADPRAPPPFS
jgi:hypothetical protein